MYDVLTVGAGGSNKDKIDGMSTSETFPDVRGSLIWRADERMGMCPTAMRRPHNGRAHRLPPAASASAAFPARCSLSPTIEVGSRLPRAAKGDRLGGETESAHDYGGREGQRAGGGQSVGRSVASRSSARNIRRLEGAKRDRDACS